jgi:hypothetical protein
MRWTMWFVAAAVVVGGAGCPMEPGETRCSTTFGVTSCKTQPFEQPQRPPGWWCTSTAANVGVCGRAPGGCEAYRYNANADACRRSGTPPGQCQPTFSPCSFTSYAFCAGGCYTTPATCADAERVAGRDGSACRVVY